MIKFNFENDVKKKQLTLDDVDTNGFFVWEGILCQKVHQGGWNTIASPDGSAFADSYDNTDYDIKVDRILGIPTKIEF